MKANLSYILLFFYLFCFQLIEAQEPKNKASSDAKISKKNNLVNQKKDTISLDSVPKPKEVIEGIITHNAEGYTIQNAKNKTLTLFDKAQILYKDIDLKAGKIIVDYEKNTVYATGYKDSVGYVQRPVFKQGSQESEQDSILFNFKTEKALIYGVKTVQGEMITYGEQTKRVNDSTIYMRKLRFTTSQKEIPDYYIQTDKAKFVPGKKIIVGASNLVLADVPTPIYLPFAYFPLSQTRTSGFIIPSWGENNSQGFFLQNGGYYFAVNDYLDLEVIGDLYTNGSWGLSASTNYNVRYKYSGRFSFRYQNLLTSIRGFDDYGKSTNYNITWSHSQDTKSSPNSRLSASVNMGSSTYYQESLNQIDQSQFLTNTFNSSINYYKKFVGTPFNMNVSMTHSQNSNTEVINMTFPSLQLSMDRIYPFAGKGGVKKNPIQKLGFTYSMQGEYKIETTDDDFFTAKMFEGARSGVQHSTSTNTNIKAFKYFTFTPSASYKDVWYFDKISKSYDPTATNTSGELGAAVNDTISGFNRFNDYSFSVSLSTNIYGDFQFKKGRLKAIRHTIRPSISWTYKPDFAEEFEREVRSGVDYTDIETYTQFEGGIYGTPSSGISNSIGISINNVLEAKVSPKDEDSDEEDKKITLLNNLNFSTSYNMAKDSIRWSNVTFSTGTRLFNNKLAVNLSGSLDPYQVNSEGDAIDKFNSDIFRLESASLTANYSISSKDFTEEGKAKNNQNNSNAAPPDVLGAVINPNNRNSNTNEESTEKTAKLYHASVPWDISFVYSSSYSNDGYSTSGIQSQTLGFSGNIELTPKWGVGFSSGYDIDEGSFSYTRLNFSRDLDSWRFNFNWIPFGTNTSYSFFIGVKSSMLSDLKWDKTKPADRVLF